MKKVISLMLIITIISSIFLPEVVLSYDDTEKTTMEDATIDYDKYKEDSESGSSDVGENGKKGYEIEDGTMNSIINFDRSGLQCAVSQHKQIETS